MRVALLAPGASIHTIRWANGLAGRGVEVHLISAHDIGLGIDPAVRVYRLERSAPSAYVLAASQLATLLKTIAPDLLHAHYATGYGLLARRAGFKPMLLSVWGSDVYDFPSISPLHRWILRSNLRSATAVASTSECMARKVNEVFPHPRLFVVPFGVDETVFVPGRTDLEPGVIVVGTVKTLSRTYGVDVLIDAFALAVQRLGRAVSLRLEITGRGPDERSLRRQSQQLGLSEHVTFHGPVPHARVPEMLRRLDIFAALSREESFGVAAIEAASCEKPVVVSDAEGFTEVTLNEETGLIVPRNNASAAADALVRLVRDEALRASLGREGRLHVLRHYSWAVSLNQLIDTYHTITKGANSPCPHPV